MNEVEPEHERNVLRPIRVALAEQKLSQAEVARRAGLHAVTVRQMTTGYRTLLKQSARELLDELGLTIKIVPKDAP